MLISEISSDLQSVGNFTKCATKCEKRLQSVKSRYKVEEERNKVEEHRSKVKEHRSKVEEHRSKVKKISNEHLFAH